MPFLEEHGIGISVELVPFMSVHQLYGRVIAINDNYYLEAIHGNPSTLNKRDKKTNKVISSITSFNTFYQGRGILSGNFYIGTFTDSGNAVWFGVINLLTGQTTNMNGGGFGAAQPIGFCYGGYNYILKYNTVLLKYDNSGNEVMTISVTGASNILGVVDNKLYYSITNGGGFRIVDINTGAQLGTFSHVSFPNYTFYNATFLKNGNMIVCAFVNDTLSSVILLETLDGLTFNLKTTLTSTQSAIMIDSRKEWFYIYRPGQSVLTRIVDNQLNTIKDKPTNVRVYTPYELADKKDKCIYASRVSVFNSPQNVTDGSLITKGVLI